MKNLDDNVLNKLIRELVFVLILVIFVFVLVVLSKNNIIKGSENSIDSTEQLDSLNTETDVSSNSLDSEISETVVAEANDISESQSSPYDTEDETFGTLDKLKFIVDVTVAEKSNNLYMGNTATKDGYSGTVEFKLSDKTCETSDIKIEAGKTYVIETSPMMNDTESGFPLLTVTDIRKADKKDINKLEKIRSKVSNFDRLLLEYKSMKLNDIITSANNYYAMWTQDEISEYIKFINSKGYTNSNKVKSLVCLKNDIKSVYKNIKIKE